MRKHGVSLARAGDFEVGEAQVELDDRKDYGESRFNALGYLDDIVHSLTFTLREGMVQAISLRIANKRSGESLPNSSLQKKVPEYGVPDEENPEWTRERLEKSMRYPNLPPELVRIIEAEKRKRGPQKAAKKEAVSIRLSADVLSALRASGPGWQSRADEGLRSLFVKKKLGKARVLAES